MKYFNKHICLVIVFYLSLCGHSLVQREKLKTKDE